MKYIHHLFILAVLLSGESAMAQPFSLDPNINPTELTLVNFNPAKQPLAKGHISVTDVTQVKDTQYYFLKGFSIYSPAYVGITAKDKRQGISIDLYKENWLASSRSGVTDGEGHWEDKFKTEGDFGIRVIIKDKPSSYALVVWEGKEADINMPSAFAYSAGGSTGGGNKKIILYAAIAAVVLLLAIVFFIKRKKK
jgi:LPXTG-motif cell wall-anchored protein